MDQTSDFLESLINKNKEGYSPGEEEALKTVFGALNAALASGDPHKFSFDELSDLFDNASSGAEAEPGEQEDETLQRQLVESLRASASIVEKLQRRQHYPPADVRFDPLCQLELQLTAAAINAESLLASAPVTKPTSRLSQRIRELLLYEFNFINNLIKPN
jgi:hypothetical protein